MRMNTEEKRGERERERERERESEQERKRLTLTPDSKVGTNLRSDPSSTEFSNKVPSVSSLHE